MKGQYILFVKLRKESRIRIGALGIKTFPRGTYAYVGSALNGIEKRIERHMRKGKKKHWHIDYLLERGKVVGTRCFENRADNECVLAQKVGETGEIVIKGFGSSDCKCDTHLFLIKNLKKCQKISV